MLKRYFLIVSIVFVTSKAIAKDFHDPLCGDDNHVSGSNPKTPSAALVVETEYSSFFQKGCVRDNPFILRDKSQKVVDVALQHEDPRGKHSKACPPLFLKSDLGEKISKNAHILADRKEPLGSDGFFSLLDSFTIEELIVPLLANERTWLAFARTCKRLQVLSQKNRLFLDLSKDDYIFQEKLENIQVHHPNLLSISLSLKSDDQTFYKVATLFPHLESISLLGATHISHLTSIVYFDKLLMLNLSDTTVTDISLLSNHPTLTSVFLPRGINPNEYPHKIYIDSMKALKFLNGFKFEK